MLRGKKAISLEFHNWLNYYSRMRTKQIFWHENWKPFWPHTVPKRTVSEQSSRRREANLGGGWGIKESTQILILVMKGRHVERKCFWKRCCKDIHFGTSGYSNKKYSLCLKEKSLQGFQVCISMFMVEKNINFSTSLPYTKCT